MSTGLLLQKKLLYKNDIEFKSFQYFSNLEKFVGTENNDLVITEIMVYISSLKNISHFTKTLVYVHIYFAVRLHDRYKIDRNYCKSLNFGNLGLELIKFNNSEIEI